MSGIKILVCYHKADRFLKSDILVPIHVGRAVASPEVKEALDGIIGDDTGDNISSKNISFCEITAIYWAWKNRAALNNPEYVGLAHYRRLYTLNKTRNITQKAATKDFYNHFEEEYVKNPAPLENFFRSHDIVIAHSNPSQLGTLKSYYAQCHIPEDIERALNILKVRYPQQAALADEIASRTYFHPFNMTVIKWELFEEYCRFPFGVIFDFEKTRDLAEYDLYQRRVDGFIAERLTSIFLTSSAPRARS